MINASPDTQKNFGVIKQDLLKTGMISAVTRTMSPIRNMVAQPAPDWGASR
jgi:hypothetical protein